MLFVGAGEYANVDFRIIFPLSWITLCIVLGRTFKVLIVINVVADSSYTSLLSYII